MGTVEFKAGIEEKLLDNHVVACPVGKRLPSGSVVRIEYKIDGQIGIVTYEVGAIPTHDAAVGLSITME